MISLFLLACIFALRRLLTLVGRRASVLGWILLGRRLALLRLPLLPLLRMTLRALLRRILLLVLLPRLVLALLRLGRILLLALLILLRLALARGIHRGAIGQRILHARMC
ncbi:MAG: hypothetical protein RR326_17110, partial [Stenotrophomonas sp.]